ncbi:MULTISPECIES: agmatine deiminase family protein [unclassified Lysobacter]|uniref:agmatine deiminase family protein n=1 Tax=unclassified Lysobacter TaxID=2635362 RepID=UPI001BE61036|nr:MULTISPECIES: agmatine deiminase family protein [unclassified Lysobacter]MBT2746073.1 agmatine deiminase family protein [Lysobacter sp. ISL-42]MBT2752508.1 agmatine deiminase family protein [Lysobacter sp. ISL-50]MBT2776763.1 agmatine deiminase family protein [Lysobacter sp. ISL-54]MBT2780669.1 agmatine deiminase family protein [Lysobacter sp. ISL-52]
MHTALPRAGWLPLVAGVLCALTLTAPGTARAQSGYMPDETARHEGTWLQWPHAYTFGRAYRDRIESTWVAMTKALVASENVHIVVYDAAEQTRVRNMLTAAGVALSNVSFLIRPTDDVWVRDNGPIFVYDRNDQLTITDWGFNGWGLDAPYRKDDTVPATVAARLGLPRVDLNDVVLEGGAIEVDGRGVLMATRSSTREANRNAALSEAELEAVLADQLGVSKFIWLDGAPGGKDDITDMHIDGFARFGTPNTLVTMSRDDLREWGLSSADVDRVYRASDVDDAAYRIVQLPLTTRNVVTSYGYALGYKGSYVNYYVGNTVVLVPEYKDANDTVAKSILQGLYPGRSVIGIDVRNLYRNGGMVHCVTQQQPVAL